MAQWSEWNHDATIDWSLLDAPIASRVSASWSPNSTGCIKPNRRSTAATPTPEPVAPACSGSRLTIPSAACSPGCGSTRPASRCPVLVAINATPTPQTNYRLGVPRPGEWTELLNSDATEFGGSGLSQLANVVAAPLDSHDQHQSIVITIPPLGVVALAPAD